MVERHGWSGHCGGKIGFFASLSEIGNFVKRGDIALALGVLAILVVLILPLPSLVLDLFFAISITLSILILMTSRCSSRPRWNFRGCPSDHPLDLDDAAAFAQPRLDAVDPHPRPEGKHAAGEVIEAFGDFVMGGNFVVGHLLRYPGHHQLRRHHQGCRPHRGSGRALHLDAMPGKQMAIDADLNAGLIDEKAARERRKALEAERLLRRDGRCHEIVRGDAIAGLLIVFINIIGGIIIGVAQQGMCFRRTARTYTLLTSATGSSRRCRR